MKHQDRDRAIERLLRIPTARTPADPSACIEPDELAAWLDGNVDTPSRMRFEAHAAACARCQALVGAMARTADAAASVAGKSDHWILRAAPWLGPLLAAGAAAAIVMSVISPEPNEAPSALNQVAAKEERAATDALREQPKAEIPRQLSDKLPSGAAADARDSSVGARAALEPAAPPLAKANEAEERQKRDSKQVAAAPSADELARRREAPADAPARSAAATNAVPPPPPPPPAAPVASPPSSTLTAAPAKPAETSARKDVAGQSAPRARVFEDSLASRYAADDVPIPSGDGKARWRIHGGYVVQRSQDEGKTWADAHAAPTMRLAAGSSPAPDVCWIVGDRGTVLVTTDGRTWSTVPFPEPLSLVAIIATSADAATVSAAGGRSFTTIDRGANWR
jgi:hypothetical protein